MPLEWYEPCVLNIVNDITTRKENNYIEWESNPELNRTKSVCCLFTVPKHIQANHNLLCVLLSSLSLYWLYVQI